MSNIKCHWEPLRWCFTLDDAAFKVLVKLLYHWNDIWRYSIGSSDLLCCVTVDIAKSIKLICRGQFHSRVCSMMILNANIWFSSMIPACSCSQRRILQKPLLGMEKNVTPRQLSHTWSLPFLGTSKISPLAQLSNKVSQDSGSCTEVCHQHLVWMECFDFRFCWGSSYAGGVGESTWLGFVQDFTMQAYLAISSARWYPSSGRLVRLSNVSSVLL